MSIILDIEPDGAARLHGTAPVRNAPTPKQPANAGHGDVRKKVVPVIKPPAGPSATAWEDGAYVDLATWLVGKDRNDALLLQPADDPRVLDGKLADTNLIGVDFPRLNDGRGYSHATWLRSRLGYRGRLRAVGQVTADQVFAMARVGFDSFALRDDQDPDVAIAALETFSTNYQDATGAIADPEGANETARIRRLERALTVIADRYERPALASSLSGEDMVITDVIARLGLPIDVFTLNTGRLHDETVALIGEVEQRYGINVAVYRPEAADVAAFVAAHGRDGFYDGLAQRKLCCSIRKVAPLARALEGRDAWITGQRRDQAITRGALPESEQDVARGMRKFNPLASWSWEDVLSYTARFDVPMSALYARGYVSIGCEPCTKAVRPGEDPRAGRWWWENEDSKECGLHTTSTTAR